MNDPLNILDEVMREALAELLSFYSNTSEVAPHYATRATPTRDAFAASLGFTADGVRGSLVLIAPRAELERVLPPELAGAEPQPSTLADWAGELANQLVGRVKNKLLRYGATITLSVPSVFSASSLQCYPRKHSLPGGHNLQLTIGSGAFEAWFDVEVAPGVELAPRPSLAAPPSEGELVLF